MRARRGDRVEELGQCGRGTELGERRVGGRAFEPAELPQALPGLVAAETHRGDRDVERGALLG